MIEKNKRITEKEKRIYDLKKKTQELEKYKFVLDFKIKELKRDIVPREAEIKNLKAKTTKKDQKLKLYNQVNTSLGKIVASLTKEEENMNLKIKQQKKIIRKQDTDIQKFKTQIYDAVQYIQQYEVLKEKLQAMQPKEVREVEENNDIILEYQSQHRYLAKSVSALKKNLEKDREIHKQDNIRIMKNNVKLIREINKLRRVVKNSKGSEKQETLLQRKKNKLK